MSRPPRCLEPGLTYHVTVRCNDRRFLLWDPRIAGLYRGILARYKQAHGFTLYAYAIMANHVHLVLRLADGTSLSQIMHHINWYSAMTFNRMLGRTGHFWEARYHAVSFHDDGRRHALATLAYVHANPKTAGVVRHLIDWRRSDYRFYLGVEPDPISTLHPAFLALADTSKARQRRYRFWAERRREKSAPSNAASRRWGHLKFPRIHPERTRCRIHPGQLRWPWGWARPSGATTPWPSGSWDRPCAGPLAKQSVPIEP